MTINGAYTYRSTVAPFTEAYMLPLAAEHRTPPGSRRATRSRSRSTLDTAPREVEVPPELAAALDADPEAKAFFDGLSYSNKRVFTLRRGTSNPETKARRVEKAIAVRDGTRPPRRSAAEKRARARA